MESKKPFWITANQLTKLLRINRKELDKIRKANYNNKQFLKQGNGRSYLYNAHALPEILLKKAV